MRKMLFLRTAWMKNYNGITNLDKPQRGGKFIEENGWGGEIYNFKPNKGKMHGYVRVGQMEDSKINITRIGAAKNAKYVDDIDVIWLATHPKGGVFIVGWYRNARVFSEAQHPKTDINRRYIKEAGGGQINYRVEAQESDCKLLPVDERVFKIEGKRRSSVWYADEKKHDKLCKEVFDYIGKGILKKIDGKKKVKNPVDPERKSKIEKSAISEIRNYFMKLGYSVESVEKDNVGWDLEASIGKITLLLEVKGLSQAEINIQLTPNEYSKMKRNRVQYRICVVTNALDKVKLKRHVFSYSPDSGEWEDESGKIMNIKPKTGAVGSCK
ncbi:MAG: DUF3883 domain-containing protein [bacterium]|jgi:hypothetical protein|nr:DUF3883 domain-containing protein [bacterium]